MAVAEAVGIGIMFAAFQTVAGTLIALLLGGVLLPAEHSDIYEAAALTAAGAVVTGILYQFFDPTFLTITTYLGMSMEQQADALYSHMVLPIARFGFAQLVIDFIIAKFVYDFAYQEKNEFMFTGMYSVTKVALALSIWVFFIVPAFAQAL